MSEAKVEIVRTRQGSYRLRLLDESGNKVPIKPGSIGVPLTAKQRADDRRAVQAGLKLLYERQQAGV